MRRFHHWPPSSDHETTVVKQAENSELDMPGLEMTLCQSDARVRLVFRPSRAKYQQVNCASCRVNKQPRPRSSHENGNWPAGHATATCSTKQVPEDTAQNLAQRLLSRSLCLPVLADTLREPASNSAVQLHSPSSSDTGSGVLVHPHVFRRAMSLRTGIDACKAVGRDDAECCSFCCNSAINFSSKRTKSVARAPDGPRHKTIHMLKIPGKSLNLVSRL